MLKLDTDRCGDRFGRLGSNRVRTARPANRYCFAYDSVLSETLVDASGSTGWNWVEGVGRAAAKLCIAMARPARHRIELTRGGAAWS